MTIPATIEIAHRAPELLDIARRLNDLPPELLEGGLALSQEIELAVGKSLLAYNTGQLHPQKTPPLLADPEISGYGDV